MSGPSSALIHLTPWPFILHILACPFIQFQKTFHPTQFVRACPFIRDLRVCARQRQVHTDGSAAMTENKNSHPSAKKDTYPSEALKEASDATTLRSSSQAHPAIALEQEAFTLGTLLSSLRFFTSYPSSTFTQLKGWVRPLLLNKTFVRYFFGFFGCIVLSYGCCDISMYTSYQPHHFYLKSW